MSKEQDIHIFYYGGSGGHCALWSILLSTDYKCIFAFPTEDNKTLIRRQDVACLDWKSYRDWHYIQHWNIISLPTWKATEQWPVNHETTNSDITPKIYLHCNPDVNTWRDSVGKRIVVYTDLLTQMTLCAYKRAGKWNGKDGKIFDQITNISAFVKNEVDSTSEKVLYNGQYVTSRLVDDINIYDADLIVRWEEIIHTDGCNILLPLGFKTTKRTKEFLKMYVKAHAGLKWIFKND